jgi:hypothetical protein
MLPQMDDLSLGSLKPVVEAAMRGYSEGDENLLTKAADTVNWRLQGNARELKTLLIQRRVLMDEAARLEDSVKDLYTVFYNTSVISISQDRNFTVQAIYHLIE